MTMTAEALIEWLESEIRKDPIVMWVGYGQFPCKCGLRGLGLTDESLIERLHKCTRSEPPK